MVPPAQFELLFFLSSEKRSKDRLCNIFGIYLLADALAQASACKADQAIDKAAVKLGGRVLVAGVDTGHQSVEGRVRRNGYPPFWNRSGAAIQLFVETMMNAQSRITIDSDICHGKPTIRGLRYPVETILELLSSGMTADEILADYEDLEREDLLAVFAYAARLSQVKTMITVKP